MASIPPSGKIAAKEEITPSPEKSYTSTNRSSNVFTVAVLVGVIGLAITTSIPGKIDGGIGFIIGFVIAFPILTIALIISTRRISNTARDNTTTQNSQSKPLISEETSNILQCPACKRTLTLTLTRITDRRHISMEE